MEKDLESGLRLNADDVVRAAIVAVMALVFLPHVFITITDINLITAFEVDPGSIFSAIDSLYRPNDAYNMLNGYHSRFYGWSFYAIIFWIYAPFHYLLGFDGIGDNVTRYVIYRFVFFAIGVLGTLCLYTVIRRVAPKLPPILGFAIILAFIFSANAHSYVFVKPGSTGTLFFLLAIWAGWALLSKGDRKFFYLAVLCMSLSTLSKQIFFFLNAPVFLFCLVYLQSVHAQALNYRELAYWRRLGKDFLRALLLGLAVAFVVHPYAFLEFQDFMVFQFQLATDFQQSQGAGSLILKWVTVLREEKGFSLIFFFIMPINSAVFFYNYWRHRDLKYIYFLVLNFCVVLCFFCVSLGNRYLITIHYLMPLVPLLMLNLAWFFEYLSGLKWQPMRNAAIGLLLLIFGGLTVSGFAKHKQALDARVNFSQSIAYRTYEFIERLPRDENGKLPPIGHDHVVAVPFRDNYASCHIWRGCGSGDYIDTFKPQYVMVQDDVAFGSNAQLKRMMRYVEDNNMKLIGEIEGTILNVVDVALKNSNRTIVYIYK